MEESAVRRPRVRDLNAHLICFLCGGYYVDATTIVDCLHSFCRSCIVRHLETSKFCPICEVQVHKAKPLHSIRPDRTLQTLVYKMVPCLYQAEVQRRREFFAKNGVTAVSPEQSGVDDGFFSPDDSISLSLEYYDSDKEADDAEDAEEPDKANEDTPLRRRYLQCPAAVSMKHLKKFIRMKFGLSSEHRVDIIYSGECLRDDFTLMDVAYTFAWKRNAPMRFSYRIFHPPVYCIPATSKKKVSTSMPEEAAEPPQLQPQEDQPPQQQDPLSSTSSSSTKVSETTPSRTDSSENNRDSSVTPETSSPSPQVDNKDDGMNSVVRESETAREETPAIEEEDEEEDNEEEMEEPAVEEEPEDEEPPHKKLCIDERKCDDDSGYEAVETREQDEEEREEEEAAMEVTQDQTEEVPEESTERDKVEHVSTIETEYKVVEEPVVEKRVSTHKSKRRRKSSHAKEKDRNRVVEEPDEVQQTREEKEAEENEEEEAEAPALTVVEEEQREQEEEEEEEQQEEPQEEEEEEEKQETATTPVEEPAPTEEAENEPEFTMRSSTSEEEEEEHVEVPPSTKPSKSAERQRESKEERRKYSKDSEERRRSKSKRDGSTREYGSRKKSKHKSKHHHRGDDTSSSKKQRKAHRLLSEVTASTPTILQYQEDVMKLKVKLGPIKPVIANLAAAAAANHQHRHHHHHHHSKHSRKLQEAKESQPPTPEAASPSPTGEMWECSTVPAKASSAATASSVTTTSTSNAGTNKTSATSSPSSSPVPARGNESSGTPTPLSVSSSGTVTTTTAITASTSSTTSVTTVNSALSNALNSTKERLLQMRAVRHKNINSNKSGDVSPSAETKQEETNNVNNKKSSTSVSEILMPSSSITVSKVTLGEKRKLGAQKANNSSGSEVKRPSLEIMLVNAPSTTSSSQSTNSSSSSSMMSKQCTSSDAGEKKGGVLNDIGAKTNRPPPPTIPLVKIRKSSVTSIRAPAGLTITPKLPSSPTSSSPVSNVPSMSCTTIPKSPISLKLSPVNSPQMRSENTSKQGSSEEQAMRHDDIGALDLSGKSSRCKSSSSASSSPQVFYRSQSSPGTGSKNSSSSPAPSIMTIAQNLVQRQLTNLQHQNNNSESPTSNGNAKTSTGNESTSNSGAQGVGTPSSLTNLKTLSDTAVHIRNMMAAQSGSVKIPQQKVQAGNSPSASRASANYNSSASRNNASSLPVAHLMQQTPSPRSSTPYHPTLPNSISPLRIPVPPSQLNKGNPSGNGSMPRLRELFPGGVGGRGRGTMGPQNRNQMKPGPNQAVRQIPNPSALLFRQTQNRLQQNAGGMSSQNRLHISTAVNSINKPVYNSPGLSTANSKPNNSVPPVSSIRKIENMTRNIEKVAAGLTVRAVEAHVSNK